jgi:hypothetical protein
LQKNDSRFKIIGMRNAFKFMVFGFMLFGQEDVRATANAGTKTNAHEIRTNEIHMADAPAWVTTGRVDDIVTQIQSLLEWRIRQIEVYWHKDQTEFEKSHGFGPVVLAISKRADNSVHLGPKVADKNFDRIFGHELVHIISYQKYKDAIPRWLEEGLANHVSHRAKVDYHWLSTQHLPDNVSELTHPLDGSIDHVQFSYMASQALMEMIASKCDVVNLLRLSIKRKLEDKLDTYCGIKDVTAEFKKWVASH